MKPLIGIAGLAGSGKDTTALLMIEELSRRGYGFSRYAFADPIRIFANLAFGYPMKQMLDRDTKEVPVKVKYSRRELRENIVSETVYLLNKYIENSGASIQDIEGVVTRRLNMPLAISGKVVYEKMADHLIDNILGVFQYKPNLFVRLFELVTRKDNVRFYLSPRTLTQKIGTEYFRNIVNKSFWTAIAPRHEIIVTDVRFPEEERFIKDNDGVLLSVYNTNIDPIQESSHESEQYINSIKADMVIVNDGESMELLRQAVVDVVDTLEQESSIYHNYESPVADSYAVIVCPSEVKES